MKVYWYIGFWTMKRISGEVVGYVSSWGTAKAVIKVTDAPENQYSYSVGKLTTVDVEELHTYP